MLERQSTSRPFQRPVQAEVNYSSLLLEIYRRVKDKDEAQRLVDSIRCHGVPGNWSVGIYIEGEGVIYPTKVRRCRNYDEGFSHLLGWLRERNFRVFDS